MLNVGTGNLAIHTTDVNIPERGINLAFQRTYNSQSLHDSNGDDGSEQAIFGNQWTNTYDTHLVFRTNGQISVYDGEGTRCDYSPNGSGGWTPCTGEYALLEPDPNPTSCSYWLIEKDGTALWFYTPVPSGNCFTSPGQVGRLYEIVGRNSNNTITLNYSFATGQPQTAQYVTQIAVNHSDGNSLIMTFAQFYGINELATITYPMPGKSGNATIQYSYDAAGDLLEVDKPGNDAITQTLESYLSSKGVPSGDLPETYGYNGPLQFLYSCGPRATISLWENSPNPATDGACIHFDFDSSARLTDWQVNGILNPQIGDQGYLQPAPMPTGWNQYYVAYFVYGAPNNPPCTGATSNTTIMCDSDGHSAIWTIDAAFRITQRQVGTGKSNPSNLVTMLTWDSNDNLIATIDPRNDQTNYAYDPAGNVTAVALPQIGSSNDIQHKGSTFRQTALYSYDPTTNNLLAFCDPSYTDAIGKDWIGDPGKGDSLCPTTIGSPTSQGATVFQYDTSDANEPFGRLSGTYTPMGYHTTIAYAQASQGGDYGLPTQIKGTAFTQNDHSQITEVENLTYDTLGNIITDGNGLGTWSISYDNVNRPTSVTDPTGVTTYTCYNEDGTVLYTTTSLQYHMDRNIACAYDSTAYAHDVDGNVTQVTRHYNSTRSNPASESSSNWYDGLDRLVEVQLPAGGGIDRNGLGKTRYIYDLTQSGGDGNLSIGGNDGVGGVTAYGNLYKVQRCIGSSCNWANGSNDLSGNSFDALNRTTARYQYTPTKTGTQNTPGANPGPLEAWTATYDQSGQQGLLTSIKDPMGIHTNLAYDGTNRLYSKTFDDGITPSVNMLFDPDGRPVQLTSSVGIENYSYDYEGKLASYVESGAVRDPETLNYTYYINGWRSKVNISDATASYNNAYKYDYRADGTRKDITFGSQSFSWTYDNAGRETQQTDPQINAVIPSNNNPQYPNGITIGSKTMQYDTGIGSGNTGVLANLTMPNGAQYQSLQYDAEGEVLGFGVSFPAFTSNQQTSSYVSSVQDVYDKRGELSQVNAGSPASNGIQTVQQLEYWNGHSICTGPVSQTACATPPPYPTGVDVNTGAAYQLSAPGIDPGSCSESQTMSYDPDGRQAEDFVATSGNGCQSPGQSLADSRLYDAESHLVRDTCSYGYDGLFLTICASNASYAWEPSGHLSMEGTNTLHWDGDQLLFITDSNHNVVQSNVEKLAWQNSQNGALVVVDRDFSGTEGDRHSGVGDHGLRVLQDFYATNKLGLGFGIPNINGQYPPLGTLPSDPVLNAARVDGYQLPDRVGGPSAVTIQGARTYDSNTRQWTTPDAYIGTTDSPMSQMQYQWNDNNPLTNSDPSGFAPFPFLDQPAGPIATLDLSRGRIYDLNGNVLTRLIYNAENAKAGWAIGRPMGRTVGSGFFGAATSEFGPEVSIPSGMVGGGIGEFAFGAAFAQLCGYFGPCEAPDDRWDTSWEGMDMVFKAGEAGEVSDMIEIAHVTARCQGCTSVSGDFVLARDNPWPFMPSSADSEEFNHVNEALGLGVDPIVWGSSNADPPTPLQQ